MPSYAKEQRFAGEVVLISGGNSGIGRAATVSFAQAGARVVIAARNAETGAETLAEVEKVGGHGHFVPCDVREPSDCERAVAECVGEFGRLDVLVNNAGVIMRDKTVLETTPEEWQRIFDVNVNGTFYLSKHALPHLIASKGNIVNVASYAGLVGFAKAPSYCASKGAVVQLTRAMALDHAADGVRVNCVCPGSVRTPMIEAAWEAHGAGASEKWGSKHPLGRIAEAQEIADAILYLASPEASFITGVALPVDGGITAG